MIRYWKVCAKVHECTRTPGGALVQKVNPQMHSLHFLHSLHQRILLKLKQDSLFPRIHSHFIPPHVAYKRQADALCKIKSETCGR